MQQHCYQMADYLTTRLRGDEIYLASFEGERSQFVRFNHAAVRQPGSVEQAYITVDLIRGKRHAAGTVTLTGIDVTDSAHLDLLLDDLRAQLEIVPDDPYLLYSTDVRNTEQIGEDNLPDGGDALDAILHAAKDRDMVGIFAQGEVFAGFANSLGQRNWFSTNTFHFDWSFYLRQDKAVKTMYAGFKWDNAEFAGKINAANEQFEVLKREPKTIPRGEYRVYIAPAAMIEIFEMLYWGGFGLKSHRTKNTSLIKMVEEGAKLHPSVTMRENTLEGIAPNFQEEGYVKPDTVTLIENGRYRDCLVSPRSAQEYGVEPNGASGYESPSSFDVSAGELPVADVLKKLDTGLYINQLWYLNYSDRPACRMTGMTRFATFWVEQGEIVAPLNVMRFDETLYRMLGSNLIGLTRERDFILDGQSYGGRSTASMRLPGALIEGFRFTL